MKIEVYPLTSSAVPPVSVAVVFEEIHRLDIVYRDLKVRRTSYPPTHQPELPRSLHTMAACCMYRPIVVAAVVSPSLH